MQMICSDYLEIRKRFKNYDKEFTPSTSEILYPPEIYEQICKYLNGNILDIGTGDGHKLENLLKHCPHNYIKRVIAIDPSPLYEIAKRRLEKYRYIEVQNIPFGELRTNKAFDTILLFDVIEHCLHPPAIIQKIAKILKPDGCVIISTPNRPIYDAMEKLFKGKIDSTHVSEMNIREFKKLIGQFFYEVKITGVLPIMKIGRKFPFILRLHKIVTYPAIYNIIICFAKRPKIR